MTFDLHCHSHFSDGTLSPTQLLSLAQQAGVTTLSITDHDTVEAYAADNPQVNTGIRLIPGIEFSTQWKNKSLHVLGLNIDPRSSDILNGVSQQQHSRYQRAERIAHQLTKIGAHEPLEGALAIAGSATLGRPHFATLLVSQGLCRNTQQAFKKFLGSGKIADIKHQWPALEDIVEWITASGGITVLAHPQKYKINSRQLTQLIDDFIAVGGKGIEVLSGQQDPLATKRLAQLAKDKGLLASMGSDFHTPAHTWIRLGMHRQLPTGCIPIWDAF